MTNPKSESDLSFFLRTTDSTTSSAYWPTFFTRGQRKYRKVAPKPQSSTDLVIEGKGLSAKEEHALLHETSNGRGSRFGLHRFNFFQPRGRSTPHLAVTGIHIPPPRNAWD